MPRLGAAEAARLAAGHSVAERVSRTAVVSKLKFMGARSLERRWENDLGRPAAGSLFASMNSGASGPHFFRKKLGATNLHAGGVFCRFGNT
jgi:hypothetical protein